MKLMAITKVGRNANIKQGEIIEGDWKLLYKRLNACFINGCELEQIPNTSKWKVYAGYGSHVADIQIEGTEQEMREAGLQNTTIKRV